MNWTEELDANSAQFQKLFGSLTSEQLNWKPAPDVWSIAQNIDHLIKINETYYPTFELIKQESYKAPFIARLGFFVKFTGNMIFKMVQPDHRKKMKTFAIWEPSKSVISGDIVNRFLTHQEGLKSRLSSLIEYADRGIAISSPANKNIVYQLSTAFDIIVSHEKRHLEQAKEVLEKLN